MKRYLVFVTGALLLSLLVATNGQCQRTYYVQSIKAKITAEPSFRAKTIAVVSKGYALTVLGKKRNWYQVKYGSLTGYVPALLVSASPPLDRQSVIKGESLELKHSVRRRASTYTSAAAARGLTADDRRRLSREERSDYEALERIEALSISDEEVMRFLEDARQ